MGRCPLAPSLGRSGDPAAGKAPAPTATGPHSHRTQSPAVSGREPRCLRCRGAASSQPPPPGPGIARSSLPTPPSSKAKRRGLLSQSVGCCERARCQRHPYAGQDCSRRSGAGVSSGCFPQQQSPVRLGSSDSCQPRLTGPLREGQGRDATGEPAMSSHSSEAGGEAAWWLP